MRKESAGDIFEPETPIVPADWDVIPFEKAAQVVSDRGKRVKQGAYLPSGRICVIDQGQDYIGGYTDDDTMAFEGELPVVLFGDHTRSIKYADKRFAVGAEGVKILRPADCYEPKFFYYFLQSLRVPSRGYSRHFQFLKRFHFPVAPKPQQKCIVAEIEKQFSRLDEGVANLKRVKANLKRYKAAVLKAAAEGKLTEEWRKAHPAVEPASELLKRILAERRARWNGKGKYREPVIPAITKLPDLPEGWSWISPEQLSSDEAYSFAIGPFGSNLKVSDYTASGVPLVFVRNIRSSLFGGEETVFISNEKAKELRAHQVSGGDVLITKMGDPPGDACLYPETATDAIITADCIKLRPSRLMREKRLIVHAINSHVVKSQILRITKGVAQLKVSLARFASIAIPLPPIAEQEQIVAEVERRFSVIEELEGQVAADLQRAERFRQSILHRAFEGKLFSAFLNESPSRLPRTKYTPEGT